MEPKKQFSSRADNYSKFRPSYPEDIISFLESEKVLSKDSIIADIGSGTGILSELFLKNGNFVFGIEPNIDMRNAAELNLRKFQKFHSIDGSAEYTNMEEDSINIVTVGQAFHWFDQIKARKEFRRILKPEGFVVIIWNNRKRPGSKFLEAYEDLLLTYGTDYREISDIQIDFEKFYGIGKNSEGYIREVFGNYQLLNYPGLKGRLLSTSYAPLDDHPNYNRMITDLEQIFKINNQKGLVRFDYETEVYYGRLYE